MSKKESGWSLKHRDNIEHGPFELEDLLTAARSGNIATDTMLRHSKHTRDQWIIATRVANIAQVLPQTVPISETQRVAKSQNTTASTALTKPTRETLPTHPPTPADTSPPASSAKSIFQRTLPRGANQAGTPNTNSPENTGKSHLAENQVPAKSSSIKRGISIRNWQEDKLLVPRTLPDAFFALFDLKFRFFITPWIVKLLWVIGIATALLMVVRLGFDHFFSPELNAEMATDKTTSSWQFEPLGGKPLLSFPAARYFVYVLAIFCGTLLLRVACEASIVMFRIAGSLAEISVILKEKKP